MEIAYVASTCGSLGDRKNIQRLETNPLQTEVESIGINRSSTSHVEPYDVS